MTDDILITDCSILPCSGEETIISPGFIAISGCRIASIGPMSARPSFWTGTVVDGRGQLALSGLVNGHCHAPMTLFRGLADDLSLSSWLQDHIFPAEAQHVTREMAYWCSKLAAAEMLLGGITAVADGYFFEDEVARAFAEAGMRCVAAQGVIDFPAPGVENPGLNIEAAQQFLEQWQTKNPLITPAVFAHAPYTCSNQTLVRAKELARQFKAPLFIHVSETRDEINQIASPMGSSPVRHLDALGLLDTDTVCVHCVWCDEEDLAILAARKTAVIVCPQSHLKLASGIVPLARMLQLNIRVGLGTDGAASNNCLDLFREMDLAAKVQKVPSLDPVAVPARRILDMATRGTAEAIGLHTNDGTLRAGAAADLILLDVQQPHMQPLHNPSHLVYSSGAADVQTVIIDGKIVVRNRRLLTIDLAETMERVRTLAARIG